jgi:ABC-type nitrate/sulfonate/bicarbonate transport system substrate-binding protein
VQNQGYNDLGLAMQYAPELAFSGTVVNKAWAARSADLLKRVLAAQSKSTEYLYDSKNRTEVVNILVKVSGQKLEDVDKSYDFFTKNNFFDRTGKISRAKMTALIEALVGLGDVKAPGNIERFLLPGVAQLSD